MTAMRDQLRSAMKADGYDHLNLSLTGETELGRVLSLDWKRRFQVPGMGTFSNARGFANWMVSRGDEAHREGTSRFFNPRIPLDISHKLMIFGKYYQLLGYRNMLIDSQELFSLPWVSYRKHPTGIREHDRWSTYGVQIKRICGIIIDNDGDSHDWASQDSETLSHVNNYLKQMAGDDFVAFEDFSTVLQTANKPNKQRHNQPEQLPSDSEATQEQEPREQPRHRKGGKKPQRFVRANEGESVQPAQESEDQAPEQQEQQLQGEVVESGITVSSPVLDEPQPTTTEQPQAQ